MGGAKKPKGEPESAYWLREEQETMLGLPTKPPEKVPEASWMARLAPEEVRLQRVVARYKKPEAPAGQMGFGLAFGAVNAANQLDMFGRPAAPVTAPAAPPSSRRRGQKG